MPRRQDFAPGPAQITDRLHELLPYADLARLAETVAALKLRPLHARELHDHLAAHDDALTSGDSDAPAAHLRLLEALVADHPQVERARCADCGRHRPLRHRGRGGRVCVTCYSKRRTEPCVRCGQTRRIHTRDEEKRPICNLCWRKDPANWEPCFLCDVPKLVVSRIAGKPLCQTCAPRPVHRCGICGRDAPAHAIVNEAPQCGTCYHKARAMACDKCGRQVPSRRRNPDGSLTCDRCWTPPVAECVVCRETKPCPRGVRDGKPMCGTCYNKQLPRRTCVRCGKQKKIHSRLPIGNVCNPCYTKIARWPAECAACGQYRPLIGRDDQERLICGPCAGDERDWCCRACGNFAALFADSRCATCVVHERVNDLLSDRHGQPHPQLGSLNSLIRAEISADPYAVLSWLYRSDWGKLLGELASTNDQFTHATLDALPPRRHVQYLRAVLVNTGVLPPRHEDLDSTTAWLDQVLANIPEVTARIIRPYAVWSVLRKARNRAQHRRPTSSVRKYIRSRILLAIRFLSWLDEHGLSLGTLTQHELDVWIDSGSVNHYRLRGFINWANARGLTTHPLEVPWVGGDQPTEFLDEEQRWNLLKRCLNDEGAELHLRAAGALLLLYGLVPIRIVELTAEDLSHVDEKSYLLLDSQPILLPPRLADLLTRLAQNPSPGRRPWLEEPTNRKRWLFPGFNPGSHMYYDRLSTDLNRQFGIRVRSARNAALCALAADLPAPVLADLFGLHIGTAVRWVHLVRRDWTEFVASRQRRADLPGPPDTSR